QDITVFGDGHQSRCFTHVSDAVDAIVKVSAHPSANGEVYNIGSQQEISIYDLACRIKELTSSDSKIVFVPYERAYEEGFEDMMRRVPDLSKINGLIGYTPKVGLDGILTSVIDDIRARLTQRRTADPVAPVK
ncbi:MAG TPA: GDP-mannose 4,6-dehydratase, partial [Terriglobales bacterium]